MTAHCLRRLTFAFLLCSATAVCGGEAQAPKLEAVSPPPAATAGEASARPLPRTLVICIDRTARRCWGGERAGDCDAGGQVFATTPAEGGDPGGLLRACWDQLR